MPPEFAVEEPSNFMTYCFLVTSAVAISPGTSSSSGNSYSPENWACVRYGLTFYRLGCFCLQIILRQL